VRVIESGKLVWSRNIVENVPRDVLVEKGEGSGAV